MQIPIINGIYTDAKADYRSSYPVNMKPIVSDTGVSGGYLRPVDGIVKKGEGPGISRGAINWEGKHYRVMGSKLCLIDETYSLTELGDVDNNNRPVTMTYSFDQLAIVSNGRLFYYNSSGGLVEVTDSDLGVALDAIWIDSYFMIIDGEYIIVTELTDPMEINPLKYGSSEIDPDPIVCILKLRNEPYVINRYTIEVFRNIGGSGFPFERINGAQIQRGALGTHCAIVYEQSIAFLGSGPGESPGIYMAQNGRSTKISTREIDELLGAYTETQLSESVMETVSERNHSLLWLRLPDKTIVFDHTTSIALEEAVWYIMSSSGGTSLAQYRGIDVIWCYDDWQVGDVESISYGILDKTISSHYGNTVAWEFSTKIVYNDSMGAVFNSLELVALTGHVTFGESPIISTSYSLDGRLWSQAHPRNIGTIGDRLKRIVWRRQGAMRSNRIQRFRGDSNAYISVSRLEAEIEPLLR